MNKVKIRFKKLTETAIEPVYSSEFAAGADLYADVNETIEFNPGETKLIGTGIATEIPDGYVGLVFARSGLATKRGLAPANKVGVIDSDYRGEIKVSLHNHTNETKTIEAHERIAQLVIIPYLKAEYELCDELSDTTRGTGGFGSTGSK